VSGIISFAMIQECKHNPCSDVERTVPSLSVDVAEIMTTHQVPSTGTTTPYNNIDNPADMGHYCTDKIQTAIAAMRLGASMAAAKSAAANTTVKPSNSEGAK